MPARALILENMTRAYIFKGTSCIIAANAPRRHNDSGGVLTEVLDAGRSVACITAAAAVGSAVANGTKQIDVVLGSAMK